MSEKNQINSVRENLQKSKQQFLKLQRKSEKAKEKPKKSQRKFYTWEDKKGQFFAKF